MSGKKNIVSIITSSDSKWRRWRRTKKLGMGVLGQGEGDDGRWNVNYFFQERTSTIIDTVDGVNGVATLDVTVAIFLL
jgi:hypothetical protein